MSLAFLENLTRAADSLARYRKVAEEVGAAEHVHFDDGIQAALRRARWAEETGQPHAQIFDAQKGLTPNRPGFRLSDRESILSDLILSHEGDLASTIDTMAEGLRTGKWDDPVVAAVKMLADDPKRIGGYDLEKAAADYQRFGTLDKGVAPNPSVFALAENALPKQSDSWEAGMKAAAAQPADIYGAAGLIDTESKLTQSHWKITSDWTNADMLRGDHALRSYALNENFYRNLWKGLEQGKVPVTPTLVDLMEGSVGAPPSRFFAADPHRPAGGYFTPEMIGEIARSEARTMSYVKDTIKAVRKATKGKPFAVAPRPEHAPGWFEPSSLPALLRGMDRRFPMDPIGGTLHALDTAANALMPFLRAPIYALPKAVTKPIIRGANMAADWTAAMDEHVGLALQGITRGSEEDRYIHMFNELTDEHLAHAERLADEHGLGSDYLQHLVRSKNEMMDWEKTQTPEKIADLQARAGSIRLALDATARLYQETGHLGFKAVGEGKPLSWYMPHVWPDGHPEFVPADALHRFSATGGAIFNPYLKHRTGQIGYEFSASHALHDYFRKAGQTLFLEPVLQAMHPSSATVTQGELRLGLKGAFAADTNRFTRTLSPAQRHYLVSYINDIRGVPAEWDQVHRATLMGAAAAAERMSRNAGPVAPALRYAARRWVESARYPRPALRAALAWNGAIMKGALGGSLGFLTKNALQAPMGVEARVGPGAYMAGLRSFATAEGARAVEEAALSKEFFSWFERQPEYDPIMGEVRKSGLLDRFGKVGGFAKWLNNATDDFVTAPLVVGENLNRGPSYLSGIAHELAKGGYGLNGMNPVAEAIQAGKWEDVRQAGFDLAHEVNFIQGTLNRNPYSTRLPFTIPLLQFTSYPYNLAETLGKWAREDKTAFLKYLASTGYLMGMASKGGIATDNWLGAAGATPAAVWTGKPGELPFKTGANEAITALSLGFAPNATAEDRRRAMRTVGPILGMLTIKGYLQLQRLQRTYEAAQSGIVRNRKGEAIAPFRGTADDYFAGWTGIGTMEQRFIQKAQHAATQYETEKAARAQIATDRIIGHFLEMTGKKTLGASRQRHLEEQMMEQLAVLQALGYDGRGIVEKLDQRAWERTGYHIRMQDALGLDASSASRVEVQRPDNLLEMEDRLWARYPELMTRWARALETLPTPYRGLSNRPAPSAPWMETTAAPTQ